MLCNICNVTIEISSDNVNERNIAILKNDVYVCLPCSDVIDFMDTPKKKQISKNTNNDVKKDVKKENKKPVLFFCNNCKINYEGKNCHKCNMTNPLYLRKKKIGKKKK